MEVDGTPTPDLDAFLKAVTGRPDRASVRLKTITWNNAPEVITLKLDKHYFPAYELTHTASGWQRKALRVARTGQSQPDLFGGPPPDAPLVRPAVPSPELLQVARRLPKNLHLGTSSLSFPGWAGIVYAQQYRVAELARHGLARLCATSHSQRTECRQYVLQAAECGAAVPNRLQRCRRISGLSSRPIRD